jgi:hypothetical protein
MPTNPGGSWSMPTCKISKRNNSVSICDSGVLIGCNALTAGRDPIEVSYVSSKFERIDLK